MEWIWLKMLGSLLLIVVLIVGSLWLLKKFMAFSKPVSGQGVGMEVAGILHLGPRRSVYAVKAGGQVILLGVAEHAITYLTQLSDATQFGATGVSQPSAQPLGAAAPFFSLLTERFMRGSVAHAGTAAAAPVQPEPVFALDAGAAQPESVFAPDATVKKQKSSAAPRKKSAKS